MNQFITRVNSLICEGLISAAATVNTATPKRYWENLNSGLLARLIKILIDFVITGEVIGCYIGSKIPLLM